MLEPFDFTIPSTSLFITAEFVPFGATSVKLWVPDRTGKKADVF